MASRAQPNKGDAKRRNEKRTLRPGWRLPEKEQQPPGMDANVFFMIASLHWRPCAPSLAPEELFFVDLLFSMKRKGK